MSIQGEGESGVDFCGSSPKGSYGSTSEETPLLRHGSRSENYRSFDEALDGVGVGVFHLVLVLVCGWAIASDSVEIQCISFVTPQLDSSNNKANQVGHTHTAGSMAGRDSLHHQVWGLYLGRTTFRGRRF